MGATDITLANTATAKQGAKTERYPAGVAIAPGQVCYLVEATGRLALGIGTSAAASNVRGVAVSGASAINQMVELVTEGDVETVTGLTVGANYIVSDATAGAMMRASDAGTGDYATHIGQAKSATVFNVKPHYTGVAHA